MKALAAIVLLLALPALAEDDAPPKPDYSRQNLVRLFAEREEPPHHLPPARVQWHFGYVDFRALGMDWRVMFLPLAIPMAGTRLNETAKVPDAFSLTDTQIAGSRPYSLEQTPYAVKREVRRVLAMERRKPR